jgi:SNF family Na+-dependent transporter
MPLVLAVYFRLLLHTALTMLVSMLELATCSYTFQSIKHDAVVLLQFDSFVSATSGLTYRACC